MAQLENFRLKVFRTVGEQLSFRKAAELLFLTQPAVRNSVRGRRRCCIPRRAYRRTGGGAHSGCSIERRLTVGKLIRLFPPGKILIGDKGPASYTRAKVCEWREITRWRRGWDSNPR
jgi:hypothetical protein